MTPALAYGFFALKVLAALRETFWGVVAEVSLYSHMCFFSLPLILP